jgi:MSHA biogenesis protein MshJ
MKKLWIALADRFDARSPRERLLVFLGLAASIGLLFFLAIFQPAFSSYQSGLAGVRQSETELRALNVQELALIQAMAADPDVETRTLNRRLDEENGALRAELSAAQAQLATPEKMTAVLRDLISAQKDLELISIRSGKIEDLLAPPAAGSAPIERGPSIFRHGIEVSVRGDYRSLTAYLKSLEGLQWKARLADLVLTTEEYPRVTMSFTLYTLSLERAWLGF